MYPTIIIIILILILAILYFIKISIELVYKKKMHTEVMRINGIASIGFIKFKLAEKYLNRLFKLDKISFSSIDTLINYLKDLSASNIKDKKNKKNKKAVKLLGKKSKIYDFFLKIKYGSGDAFYTAMIFGLLSVTLSALITLMKSSGNSTIEINDIELVPDFIENVFEVDFACIIEVKLGNIITIKTIKR